jgi:hypothetical protein
MHLLSEVTGSNPSQYNSCIGFLFPQSHLEGVRDSFSIRQRSFPNPFDSSSVSEDDPGGRAG